jgi:hypothetical protein
MFVKHNLQHMPLYHKSALLCSGFIKTFCEYARILCLKSALAYCILYSRCAGVMELADVLDSKSCSPVHPPECASPDKYGVLENKISGFGLISLLHIPPTSKGGSWSGRLK